MSSELDTLLLPVVGLAIVGIVIGAVVTLAFGGKWVLRLWLIIMAGIVLYLLWFFFVSSACCPTGMEGLALFILPSLGLSAGVGLFLGYGIVTIFQELMGDT